MLLLGLAACGPDRPDCFPVTGTVAYRGQPVAGAEVVFTPAGRPARGVTDAQGRFALGTFNTADGAIAGEHRVAITKREMVADPRQPDSPYKVPRDLLPARYASPAQSGLKATIEPGGPNDFRFELSD